LLAVTFDTLAGVEHLRGSAPDPLVARRLNGERLVILGWSRAILLQMAHPLIAAGVARHSTFRGGAREAAIRAHGTIKAMLALTFGEPAAHDATIARIRNIHTRVNGTLTADAGQFTAGTHYSAEDPALLLWVHATLLDSITRVYQLVVAPLSTDALDAFCRESAPTLLALGGDPAAAPRSWRALTDYMDTVLRSGTLHVTPEGRDIARAVLSPGISGVPLPGTSIHRLFTLGLLPAPLRDEYGFAWNERSERRLRRAVRVLRAARRITPDVLARWHAA
jgi:uncharacterized protein (DUF2236 family)